LDTELNDKAEKKIGSATAWVARIIGLIFSFGPIMAGIWGAVYCLQEWHLRGYIYGLSRLLVLSLLLIGFGCVVLSAVRKGRV